MQYFFVFNQAFYCSKQNIRFPLASVPSDSIACPLSLLPPPSLLSKRLHFPYLPSAILSAITFSSRHCSLVIVFFSI